MYQWDEAKREANLRKHGLDFVDAYVVYENPSKITLSAPRDSEDRYLDIAMVEVAGRVLSLVYALRDENVRVISFRAASKRERRFYETHRGLRG